MYNERRDVAKTQNPSYIEIRQYILAAEELISAQVFRSEVSLAH